MTQTHELERIASGREAEIFAWEPGTVLRLFRTPRSEATLEREIAAMRAGAAATGFVPAVHGRVQYDGRDGLIMERVDGPDLLTIIGKKPWMMWSAGQTCGRVHATLHKVIAPPELDPLKERARLSISASSIPRELRDWALDRLQSLPDGDRILHGDFHPANVLSTTRGPVVIDWPNATAGDPHADVANTILLVSASPIPDDAPRIVRIGAVLGRRILLRAYRGEYRRNATLDARLLERWLPVMAIRRLTENIPEERDYLLSVIDRGIKQTA
jgi:aminoglycoside phosphotransferase (APT) family kinase protein